MPASLRGAPFGVPVVPDVRITIRACRSGATRSDWFPDSINRSTVGRSQIVAVNPGDDLVRDVCLVDQLCELLVIDDDRGPVTLEDLDELGSGEGGVEVEDVGAELGGGDRGVEEATVVATHDRHTVAFVDTQVREGMRQRIRTGAAPRR